jgi:cytochrome c556
MNLRNIVVRSLFGFMAVLAPATVAAQQGASAASGTPPPVAYASVSELNGMLAQLQQTAQSMQSDLGKMRIEKWKTGASTKQQTLANVESIQRNLQSALPEIIAQLNNAPEDLGMSFKLYRNLDALYDVFGSVVESAGAFGSKDEFQSLGNDMSGLESARHAFGERMQKLSANKEDELTHLRAQIKTLSAAPPPPPKKIIVDDTEPPPKPAVKKKVTKPKPPATTTNSPPSAAPTK